MMLESSLCEDCSKSSSGSYREELDEDFEQSSHRDDSKIMSYIAPRVIIHEILFMDSFLFYFTVKTSLTSVRWCIQSKNVTKEDPVIGHELQVYLLIDHTLFFFILI